MTRKEVFELFLDQAFVEDLLENGQSLNSFSKFVINLVTYCNYKLEIHGGDEVASTQMMTIISDFLLWLEQNGVFDLIELGTDRDRLMTLSSSASKNYSNIKFKKGI